MEAVSEFCELVESVTRDSVHSEHRTRARLASLLAELYSGAAQLPFVSQGQEDVGSDPEEIENLELLGFEALLPRRHYWALADPLDPKTLEEHDLYDDIRDVYVDLAEGRSIYQSGAPLSEAAWHWRTLFDVHWGLHAVNALKALHHMTTRAET